METKDIIKYALIAAGAYLLYVYVIEPLMAAPAVPAPTTGTGAGTGTPGGVNTIAVNPSQLPRPVAQPVQAVNPVPSPPAPTPPPPAAPDLATQLVSLAGVNDGLNSDQWSYYYAQLPGRQPIDPTVFGNMLAGANLTHDQPIGVHLFVTLLQNAGLSGIVPTIPIRATPRNLRGGFSGAGRVGGFAGVPSKHIN